MPIRFFLQNVSDYYTQFSEAVDVAAWSTSSGMAASINTSFADPHTSVMQAGFATGLGTWQQFAVNQSTKYVTEFEYRSAHTLKVRYSDVSDGGLIIHTDYVAPSTPYWSNYYHEETLPVGCNTLTVYIFGTAATMSAYLDNFRFQGNVIAVDPEIRDYPVDYLDANVRHTTLNGNIKIDAMPRLPSFNFHFARLDHDQFMRLYNLVNTGEPAWFNDGAVPDVTEYAYLYPEATDDYTDTANNKAYDASSQTLSAWATLFESSGTEFSAASYTIISTDGNNYVGSAIAATLDYWNHKFTIKLTEITDTEDVQSLDVLYKGCTNNVGTEQNGVQLYLWDGNRWTEVGSAYASEKSTINFNTTTPAIAQRFVNASGATLYIKAIARSASANELANDVELDSYYFRTIVNDSLSDTITLKHKAILDTNGDVEEVKDMDTGHVMTLNTDYRISEDRQSIIATAATIGHRIKVDYNRYYYVIPTQFTEQRLHIRDGVDAPVRSVDMTLEGIVGE